MKQRTIREELTSILRQKIRRGRQKLFLINLNIAVAVAYTFAWLFFPGIAALYAKEHVIFCLLCLCAIYTNLLAASNNGFFINKKLDELLAKKNQIASQLYNDVEFLRLLKQTASRYADCFERDELERKLAEYGYNQCDLPHSYIERNQK